MSFKVVILLYTLFPLKEHELFLALSKLSTLPFYLYPYSGKECNLKDLHLNSRVIA
jgi:hypothetical protein